METDGDARRALTDGHDGTALLAEFGAWLNRERGLSPVSVRCYVKQARLFLAAGSARRKRGWRGLDAGQVTGFVIGYCQDRNRWSAKAMVTSLRAFLRFAHATGRTAVPLAGCSSGGRVVAAGRRCPAGCRRREVERLLAGCDRTSAVGPAGLRGLVAAGPARPARRRGRRAAAGRHRLAGRRDRGHAARAAGSSGSRCRPRPGRRSRRG